MTAVRSVVVLSIATLAMVGGAPFAPSASAASKAEVAVSWPQTGFVSHRLVIRGQVPGMQAPVSVVLQRRKGHGWRPLGHAVPQRSGAFVVVSRRAGNVGAVRLRLVVRRGAAVLARRFATVRIRPLPIVIPASRVLSTPPIWEGGGWIRFTLARASRCPRVATGPTVYKNNFVAVGYNAGTSPHGFLGQIQSIQCKGRTGRIRASSAALEHALGDGSLDLARFVQVAGQKSFSYTFDDVPCSPGVPATVSGSVDLNVVPRLTMQYAAAAVDDNGVSFAAFTVTGTANVALAVDAKAGATCAVSLGGLGGNDNSVATLEGQVGPFPVVVDLFGGVFVDGAIKADADASDAIKASGDLAGGVAWGGRVPINGSSFSVADAGPTVTGTADAYVRVLSQIAVGIYGQAGAGVGAARLQVSVGLHLHADTARNPWWDVTAPVTVDAALPSFGNSAPILAPLMIYADQFHLASAGGPFVGPTGT